MRSSDAQFSYNVVKVISCLSFLTRLCSAGILPEEQKAQLKDICNLKQFFLVLQRYLIGIMLLSARD